MYIIRVRFRESIKSRKSKKLALIAVAIKLLKQAFAIIKSGRPYDEIYRSKLA